MKIVISAGLVVAASCGLWGCSVETVDETFDSGGSAISGKAPATVAIHRAYNPALRDHVQGTLPREGERDGWIYEGARFSLFASSTGSDRLLYRCLQRPTSFHFLTTDPGCEGYYAEGPLGYVSTTRRDGLVPLYRCWNAYTNDHVSTTDLRECTGPGWLQEEPLQGYVLP